MSKLSKHADKLDATVNSHKGEAVTNFMGMNSYKLNPLDTLRIVAASSIFGEAQYYREGMSKTPIKPIRNLRTIEEYSIFSDFLRGKGSAADVFTAAIDNALNYDFKGTLELAFELRKDYFMRLNPAVIFVRADMHKDRTSFNEANPGYMRSLGRLIAQRPDDITNQFEYFMYLNKSKKGLSSLMKRTWADALQSYSRYQLNKYKGKRLIDLVRLSHAHSTDIDELMKTGTLVVSETEQTWETMRSAGNTWMKILTTLEVPHMALLRNLRGIFTEIKDKDQLIAKEVIAKLIAGVPGGKQFPFRYYSAYKAITDDHNITSGIKRLLLSALEDCLDKSVENMPKLEGRTICLSDNSGSAWGAVTSEYGTTKIAEIANLSSLITALQSDDGEVGVFGDRLSIKTISKRNGLLAQLEETSQRGKAQGGGTENGIWLFFKDALNRKVVYDNIFIYSDMQAGHGGLYGTNSSEYREYAHKSTRNIDVLALVEKYRQTVNRKVNIFTVQVAGYDNSVLPENLYRGAILAGWTGREPIYAKAIIDTWNEVEQENRTQKASRVAVAALKVMKNSLYGKSTGKFDMAPPAKGKPLVNPLSKGFSKLNDIAAKNS